VNIAEESKVQPLNSRYSHNSYHRGAPLKRARKRMRVGFRSPLIARETLVPALCDLPKWVRDEMYWGAEDYAAIRDNQRRLIELVMRQVRDYPDGVLPPPIPGESRRGLGIICEPGTNSGRAARVRSARRAVVEAYRDGYSADMIGKLAQELSLWATKNAYDVGLKDHLAVGEPRKVGVGDFDFASFRHSSSVNVANLDNDTPSSSSSNLSKKNDDSASQRQRQTTSPMALEKKEGDFVEPPEQERTQRNSFLRHAPNPHAVARAQRREDQDDISAHSSADDLSELSQQPTTDGLGLASMIRNDSYNNLLQHRHQHHHSSTKTSDDSTVENRDGLGLASMIRNDSLGNLAGLDTAPDNTNIDLEYENDQDQDYGDGNGQGGEKNLAVEAY